MTEARGALPTFVVIGAQKSGTTALHAYLSVHPGISMSSPKELNFFIEDWNWPKGVDWYGGRFDARLAVRGESSPHYTAHPHWTGVPQRMAQTIPDARLIYLVRDPLARIASHYTNLWMGRREQQPLSAVLAPTSRYVIRSRYMYQLEQFLAVYPRDRILAIEHRDLLTRRHETLERVYRFVGADATFRAPHQDVEINRTAAKRQMSATGAVIRRHVRGGRLDSRLVKGLIRVRDQNVAQTGHVLVLGLI